MNKNSKKVVGYFSNLETRLGFDLILWGSKHFGYYPSKRANISEKKAQLLMQDLVAQNLALKKGQKILDAGCGQGVVSTYLAKKYNSRVFGITIVPFEVKRAEKLANELSVQDKTDYQVMDYSKTNFSDNFFDAIYTNETLSHSPDIRITLKEFFRVLKPGGKIALFEYTLAPDEQFDSWERKMLDLVIEGSAMMGLKDFRHDQFTKVLKNTGFVNVNEQNISEHVRPSFYRLHNFSKLPYRIIKLFGLQRFFINTTAGYEYYKMADRGLFRYCIFTGQKPK
jgi:cyclopropane fatty-acyl-phospholipid synthase-like methyltransferase